MKCISWFQHITQKKSLKHLHGALKQCIICMPSLCVMMEQSSWGVNMEKTAYNARRIDCLPAGLNRLTEAMPFLHHGFTDSSAFLDTREGEVLLIPKLTGVFSCFGVITKDLKMWQKTIKFCCVNEVWFHVPWQL